MLTVVNKTQQIVKLSKQSSQSDLFHSAWDLHKALQPVSQRVWSSFQLPDTNENVQCPTPAWHDSGARGPQSRNSFAMRCKACPTLRSMCFWFLNVLLPNNVSALERSSMYKEHIVPRCQPQLIYDISAAPAGMFGFNSASCHWPITALQRLLFYLSACLSSVARF